MDRKTKAKILYRLDIVADSTSNLTELLISLVSKNVLSINEMEIIRNASTTLEKYESLYITITRKGPDAFKHLVTSLCSTRNDHVAKIIESDLTDDELQRLSRDTELRNQVWLDIKEPVDNFCGRLIELQQLKDYHIEQKNIDRQKVTVICGLGGIGKTELARMFALKLYKNSEGHCVWVHGETDGLISASFKRLASHSDIKVPLMDELGNERRVFDLVIDIYTVLGKKESLLVIDNVNEFTGLIEEVVDAITRLAPGLHRPFIVITSRNKKLLTPANILLLDVWTEDAAVEFVRKSLNLTNDNFDRQAALELCTVFQFFPLALSQAVSYISYEDELSMEVNNAAFGIEDYLSMYETHRIQLLNSFPEVKHIHAYTQTTFLTWNLTLSKIRENSAVGWIAEVFVNIISFCAPDSIRVAFLREAFVTLVSKGLHKSSNQSCKEITSPKQFWCVHRICCWSNKSDKQTEEMLLAQTPPSIKEINNALHLINRYSMFQMKFGEITVHRLVQEVIRLSLTPAVISMYLDKLLSIFELRVGDIDEILHARTVWTHAVNEDNTLIHKYVNLPDQIFATLKLAMYFEDAQSFAKYATEVLKKVVGDAHPATVDMEHNLGDILHARGEYQQSVHTFKQVIQSKTKLHGEESSSTLETRREYAVALMRTGQYNKSLEECEKLCEIKEQQQGSAHPSTLVLKNNMALILNRQGRHREALQLLKETYEVQRKVLGDFHPDVLTSYKNIASTLASLGEHEEAFIIHSHVHEAREKVLGADDPDTIGSLAAMGLDLLSFGRYDDALVVLEGVSERRKKVLGVSHPDFLMSRNVKGVALSLMGRFDESLTLHYENLSEIERHPGETYPLKAITLQNIAFVLNKVGRHDEALEIFTSVSGEQLLALGPQHGNVLTMRGNIALTLSSMGRYDEANKIFQDVYETRVKSLGELDANTLLTKHNMGANLIKMGEVDEGLKILQSAWVARKEVLGEEHPATKQYFDELKLLNTKLES